MGDWAARSLLLVTYVAAFVASWIISGYARTFIGKFRSEDAPLFFGLAGVVLGSLLTLTFWPQSPSSDQSPDGGIAFVTTDPKMDLKIDVMNASGSYGSKERVLSIRLEGSGSGTAPKVAVIASGVAQVEALGLTDGNSFGMQLTQGETASAARYVDHIFAVLRPSSSSPFRTTNLGISLGGSGLQQGTDSPWFDPNTAAVYVLPFRPAGSEEEESAGYRFEQTVLVRLKSEFADENFRGSLGEIGCPAQLFQQAGQGAESLVSITGHPGPWVSPHHCSVDVALFEATKGVLVLNGERARESVVRFKAEQTYQEDAPREPAASNHLTVPRTTFRIDAADADVVERREDFKANIFVPIGFSLAFASLVMIARWARRRFVPSAGSW